MDPITTAIVSALTAGATSGLTETSKTVIADAYQTLKELLVKKFGTKSQVIQAIDHLEAKPISTSRQGGLQEEISTIRADQDGEVLAAASRLSTLIQTQQVGSGKFTIQNNAPVQGQTVGDYNTITQQFGEPPKA